MGSIRAGGGGSRPAVIGSGCDGPPRRADPRRTRRVDLPRIDSNLAQIDAAQTLYSVDEILS